VDRTLFSAQPDVTAMNSLLKQLRESIQNMLQWFLNVSLDKLPHNMEPPATTTDQPHQDSTELLRFFVVVMDYDPSSLCTTGHPEQELTLPSGSSCKFIGYRKKTHYLPMVEKFVLYNCCMVTSCRHYI